MGRRIDVSSIFKKFQVSADIDYNELRTPTYDDQFSKFPKWVNNKTDQFLCTAQFRENYISNYMKHKEEGISRTGTNMLPVFFAFESDNLPILEQKALCDKLISDNKRIYVFSQTFSGNKSIHTLVWIKPEFRESVALDFKFYWTYVCKMLFGEDQLKNFDSQCASIGRLSRNPNGIRQGGIEQTCIFYNPNYRETPIPLDSIIKKHTEELRIQNIKREEAKKNSYKFENYEIDEMEKLRKLYTDGKKRSESFMTACMVLIDNNCPKGANYVGAAASLKGYGFSMDIIRKMLERASIAHPTNISQRSIEMIINKLRSK